MATRKKEESWEEFAQAADEGHCLYIKAETFACCAISDVQGHQSLMPSHTHAPPWLTTILKIVVLIN